MLGDHLHEVCLFGQRSFCSSASPHPVLVLLVGPSTVLDGSPKVTARLPETPSPSNFLAIGGVGTPVQPV